MNLLKVGITYDKNFHFYIQENQFHLFVRAGESQPFILKVKVPDNRIDTCLYKGVDTYDSSITADIQLCPNVVRLLQLQKRFKCFEVKSSKQLD